jgi:hypothetical protein
VEKPMELDFDNVRKSKHQINLNEFNQKIKSFKKNKNVINFTNNNITNVNAMKNQSEMIKLDKQNTNIMKNRSFRKKYNNDNKTNYNLYGNTGKINDVQEIKKKFNLTGELNFTSKTQNSAKTENKFYKSKNKEEPQSMNIYNLLQKNNNDDENKVTNQPIQLLKTRSKNSSFVKKKVGAFGKPLEKNFEIKLYEGKRNEIFN